jgi:hypothetical protein
VDETKHLNFSISFAKTFSHFVSDPFIENTLPSGDFFKKQGGILKGGVIFRSLYCFLKAKNFFSASRRKKRRGYFQ